MDGHAISKESKGVYLNRMGNHADVWSYNRRCSGDSTPRDNLYSGEGQDRKRIKYHVPGFLDSSGFMSVEAMIVLPIFLIVTFSVVMGLLHFVQYEMLSSALNHYCDPVILQGQLSEENVNRAGEELDNYGFSDVEIWAEDLNGDRIGTGPGQVVYRDTLNPDLARITVKLKATPSINPYQILNFLTGEKNEAFAFKIKKVVYSDRAED